MTDHPSEAPRPDALPSTEAAAALPSPDADAALPSPDADDVLSPDDDDALPSPEALREVAEPAVVRRAPRYRSFVLAGALVGVLLAVVLVLVVPGDQPLGRGPVLVFVGLTAVAVMALLGAVVAVLVDRSTRR